LGTNCARGIALLGGAVVGSFTDGLPVTCGLCEKKHRTAYNVSITTIEHISDLMAFTETRK
jgi:hypothetical protein